MAVTVAQWCRQLWGTGARAPSTFNIFLLHFGVNLTANNPSIIIIIISRLLKS